MAKITINPRFLWSDELQRFTLASHDGQYEIPDHEILIRADRGVQKAASTSGKQAGAQADQYGSRGTTEENAIIPGLVQDAQNPTGYTPLQRASMITSGNEALGGVNSGASGEARLNSMRTRNAAGFAPALAEAARAKGRAAASTGLQINMGDAALAEQKRQEARSNLMKLYGIDTGQQLGQEEMQNRDLQTQLEGGKSGWLQNTLATINTLGGMGLGAAKAAGFG